MSNIEQRNDSTGQSASPEILSPKVFCPKCKCMKERAKFHKNKANRSGLQSWCIACVKKGSKQRKNKVVSLRKKNAIKTVVVGELGEDQLAEFAKTFAEGIGGLIDKGKI